MRCYCTSMPSRLRLALAWQGQGTTYPNNGLKQFLHYAHTCKKYKCKEYVFSISICFSSAKTSKNEPKAPILSFSERVQWTRNVHSWKILIFCCCCIPVHCNVRQFWEQLSTTYLHTKGHAKSNQIQDPSPTSYRTNLANKPYPPPTYVHAPTL